MMRRKILYAWMAASFGFVAMTATAQATALVQHDDVDTAPARHSIVAPAPGSSGGTDSQSLSIAPMNVMEDVPRDMSGKRARTDCDSDPVTGQMLAACHRWLEIARTL
jgi:hypothetical protein